MSIFIKSEQVTPEKHKVVFWTKEYDKFSNEDKEQVGQGHFVDEIPEPVSQPGKVEVLYFNPDDNNLWYEYIDRPLTIEEQLKVLFDENELLKQQLETTAVAVDFILTTVATE